jgi:hypothetical protein
MQVWQWLNEKPVDTTDPLSTYFDIESKTTLDPYSFLGLIKISINLVSAKTHLLVQIRFTKKCGFRCGNG